MFLRSAEVLRRNRQMQIELRSATQPDIPLIDAWAKAIDADRFMSRYLPDHLHKILWEIVIVDGVDIGHIGLKLVRDCPMWFFSAS